MKYKNIFQEGSIGKLKIKNRIVMPAMGTGLTDGDGLVNRRIAEYYLERARAGCGLIITEIARVDQDTGVGLKNQIDLTSTKVIPSLKGLVDEIHKYGTKIFIQLQHPGRQLRSFFLPEGKSIVAPSPLACPVMKELPDELTLRNIQVIINRFAISAKIAQESGADGVELHAAHGYLISQFISPNTNLREDKYGGNIYNRLNFLKEIIGAIREICGSDFPIIVRINADDFVEGGLDLSEAKELAKIIEGFGIDALNVSCGNYESTHTIIEPISYKEGWRKNLAKSIKEVVSLPIIATNTLRNPKTADSFIEEDVCDFVALGRAQLADSQWVSKAYNNQEDLIRPCISCLYCIENVMKQKPIKCAVNPRLGLEYKYPLVKPGSTKENINKYALVVGGGPAGLEASISLKLKGFSNVKLLEKNSNLGGSTYLGSLPDGKEVLLRLIKSMEKEARDLGVKIELNKEANLDFIENENPDYIFLALGGNPIIPKIDGINGPKVLLPSQVLKNELSLKDKEVFVIGSGLTGMETAEYLARDNRVTIMDMEKSIGKSVYATNRFDILKRLKNLEVKMLPSSKLVGLTESGLLALDSQNNKTEYICDYLILCLGVSNKLNDNLVKNIKDRFSNVYIVGDSLEVGQIAKATSSSFTTVANLSL